MIFYSSRNFRINVFQYSFNTLLIENITIFFEGLKYLISIYLLIDASNSNIAAYIDKQKPSLNIYSRPLTSATAKSISQTSQGIPGVALVY